MTSLVRPVSIPVVRREVAIRLAEQATPLRALVEVLVDRVVSAVVSISRISSLPSLGSRVPLVAAGVLVEDTPSRRRF